MRSFRRPTPAMIATLCFSALLCSRILSRANIAVPDESTIRVVSVARVLDGDTFECTDGQRIRLLGIDAPELEHSGHPAEKCSRQSALLLTQLIDDRDVRLRLERRKTDRYGRTLAWVFDSDDRCINREMLHAGMARLLADFGLPQDLEPLLRSAEAEARVRRAGIWARR